jgi:hypothetical protein
MIWSNGMTTKLMKSVIAVWVLVPVGALASGYEDPLHDVQLYEVDMVCNPFGKARLIDKEPGGTGFPSRFGPGCHNHGDGKSKGSFKFPYLYRKPASIEPANEDYAKSCAQIQLEMNALDPMTYPYKPGFHDDPYNRVAVAAGTLVAWPFYALMGVTTVNAYQEEARIEKAEDRIEQLRYLKARKHCFER